jgi:hypothetical protein
LFESTFNFYFVSMSPKGILAPQQLLAFFRSLLGLVPQKQGSQGDTRTQRCRGPIKHHEERVVALQKAEKETETHVSGKNR